MSLLHLTQQNLQNDGSVRKGYLFLIAIQITLMQIQLKIYGESLRLGKYYPSNLEKLKQIFTEVWEWVTLEVRCDLIDSLPKRINEIVNAKGATTEY